MGELGMRQREMRDEDENDVQDYKWTWQIMGAPCLTGSRRPHIGVIACQISTRTCCIGDSKLTHTRDSLMSQFLIMNCPIPSHLFLSCPQLYHHLGTRSQVITLGLSLP
jgi:hypothetical protein